MKQLISRVLVHSLKKAKFCALHMLEKQNLTHPKAAKLATLLWCTILLQQCTGIVHSLRCQIRICCPKICIYNIL